MSVCSFGGLFPGVVQSMTGKGSEQRAAPRHRLDEVHWIMTPAKYTAHKIIHLQNIKLF